MKKLLSTFTNTRVWVLFALAAVAIITLLSEPTATDLLHWGITMVISKTIGAIAAIAFVILTRRWAATGTLGTFGDLLNEEE